MKYHPIMDDNVVGPSRRSISDILPLLIYSGTLPNVAGAFVGRCNGSDERIFLSTRRCQCLITFMIVATISD